MNTSEKVQEKTRELGRKAVSLRFWIRGLIDSIIIGGATAVIGMPAVAYTEIAALDWDTAGTMFVSGALANALKFYFTNPLTSIEKL